jgi:hypothetical protein
MVGLVVASSSPFLEKVIFSESREVYLLNPLCQFYLILFFGYISDH